MEVEPKARKLTSRDAQQPRGRRVIVDRVLEPKPIPDAYWELFELVQTGCPETALKEFRTTLMKTRVPLCPQEKCMRGKTALIDAQRADIAIRAAKCFTWGSDKPEAIEKNIAHNGMPVVASLSTRLLHADMLASNGWIVPFARRAGEEWPTPIRVWLASNECPVSLLEFDDDAVDRIAA